MRTNTNGSKMNNIQIEQGDAIELFATIKSNSIDLIIADPPYNLGKNYGNNHDLRDFEDYLQFSSIWLKEAYRVLKPTGSIYVFMGVRFISYIFNITDQGII
ncbi:MAG: hypothetical protein OMM_07623 [Candidatus Magnetoglobus multicellularis str. Araruama]|uniref:DNA methylase N-4/N-6 domain-containing protein n=1 Tax=Candidatus Magnetoglobus multicellularis str. Araruama TaxID=890399 RepID=A0A1V1PBH9_9BACT|nr:MAG: hypothetical protein OMM_07623 [Candidatus Magnetoglobus multicellularis str. Araruama]